MSMFAALSLWWPLDNNLLIFAWYSCIISLFVGFNKVLNIHDLCHFQFSSNMKLPHFVISETLFQVHLLHCRCYLPFSVFFPFPGFVSEWTSAGFEHIYSQLLQEVPVFSGQISAVLSWFHLNKPGWGNGCTFPSSCWLMIHKDSGKHKNKCYVWFMVGFNLFV